MLTVKEMQVDEIIPYENNPRKNDSAVEKVAASIQEFGFKVPIIIDKNNVVVAGHTRLKAAKHLGLKTVPVILADDLTEDQIRAYRLADNKVSGFSTWNFMKLSEEQAQLEDFGMDRFGFETFDFEDIDNMENKPKMKTITCPYCGTEFEVPA